MEQDQQSATERIERVLNDPNGPGARNIIAGQCNLGMLLVLWLAQKRGARSTDDLMADAAEILPQPVGMSPSSGALTPPPGPDRRRRGG